MFVDGIVNKERFLRIWKRLGTLETCKFPKGNDLKPVSTSLSSPIIRHEHVVMNWTAMCENTQTPSVQALERWTISGIEYDLCFLRKKNYTKYVGTFK